MIFLLFHFNDISSFEILLFVRILKINLYGDFIGENLLVMQIMLKSC